RPGPSITAVPASNISAPIRIRSSGSSSCATSAPISAARSSTTLADFERRGISKSVFLLLMGRRPLEGPTMGGMTSDWKDELERFLKPFLDRLGHKARRQMCPLYVSGLIGPGDRKSVQPMAERVAVGDYDQLHHFIAAGVWDAGPVETELLVQADKLVGGSDAVVVIDDTAIAKKGTHSVGVAAQYASALGKTANCQTLVSLTLARGEVPVVLALRLFLPESWTNNRARLDRAAVPAEYRTARTKPELALVE